MKLQRTDPDGLGRPLQGVNFSCDLKDEKVPDRG